MINKTYKDWIIEKTKLDNVVKIIPTVFKDFRGEYIETYNKDFMIENKIDIEFLQDDISVSKKNVLRGIHGNKTTWKLVSCLYGSFQLIVVNNDKDSKQYKKWESFELSSENKLQILVPPKFGNGHLVTSEKTIFHYKQNTQYDRNSQFTIKWNDPEFKFKWKINDPILSDRDK
jgi:dTDP-4-dehydrorhamnose 3,5-epimerase